MHAFSKASSSSSALHPSSSEVPHFRKGGILLYPNYIINLPQFFFLPRAIKVKTHTRRYMINMIHGNTR